MKRERRASKDPTNSFDAVLLLFEWKCFVREEGLEPSHPEGHRHLKPARLPIPPLARVLMKRTVHPEARGKSITASKTMVFAFYALPSMRLTVISITRLSSPLSLGSEYLVA
tara:strand:+ start:2646 stop:2981 length:336 start_codon:yes stop_codon:yes gene_type:complete